MLWCGISVIFTLAREGRKEGRCHGLASNDFTAHDMYLACEI
jgi:hypothetical protein